MKDGPRGGAFRDNEGGGIKMGFGSDRRGGDRFLIGVLDGVQVYEVSDGGYRTRCVGCLCLFVALRPSPILLPL